MAIAGLSVKTGSKGKATAHANYVARTGGYERYLERGEVLEARDHGNLPAWAEHDPSVFWVASDAYERANGSSYREFQISLPRELDSDQRRALVEEFVAQEIGSTHAYQYAIHVPKASDGKENPHVHLMFSERRVDGIDRDPDQYFKRYNAKAPEKGGARKGYGAQPGAKLTRAERAEELKDLRARWEVMVNHSLERAGVDARVNMKSYRDRGLDIAPEPKQLPSAWRGAGKAETLAFRAAREAELAVRREPEAIIKRVSSMKAIFTRRDLYRALSTVTDDAEQFAEIKAKLDGHLSLVALPMTGIEPGSSTERLTTRESIASERSVLALGDAMVQKRAFGLKGKLVEKAVSSLPFSLSDEQVSAVNHVTGDERLSLVSGVAGAGKSTMLSVVRDAYEAAGYRVSGMALAGKAADELTQSSGINSRTIASWLYRHEEGQITLSSKDVVVLDEAGMVHNGIMERVLDAVNRSGAKAILVGDAEQLQPIQAGSPFLTLSADHGAEDITQVRRQSADWQREATQALSKKDGAQALKAYRDAGCVHEAAQDELVPQLVDRYLEKGEDTGIILAHRKVDVAMLNAAVRDERKARGELQGAEAFTASLELAVGDRVVFTRNDKQVGVLNGQFGDVVGLEEGRVTVARDNGSQVSFSASEYNDLQHGYASTIHKSQGMTVDRAMVWGSASMDRHLAYVAMSRHRTQLDVYQPFEASKIRTLEACVERSSQSATIESTMAANGLSTDQEEGGRLTVQASYPTAAEVDKALGEVRAVERVARASFRQRETAVNEAVDSAKSALQAHRDVEPSDKKRHLIRRAALLERQDWENALPVLENAVFKAEAAQQAWQRQQRDGANEEKAVRDAVRQQAPNAKSVLEANRSRENDQQDLRRFSALEKTLESDLRGQVLRNAKREHGVLASKLDRKGLPGLEKARIKTVSAERTRNQSRGGLER